MSSAHERLRNASTTRNATFYQFLMLPNKGIEIREGDKFDRTTLQYATVQTKIDLKGKAVAQSGCKFFFFFKNQSFYLHVKYCFANMVTTN